MHAGRRRPREGCHPRAPAGQKPVRERARTEHAHPARRVEGRCGLDVPGVPREAGGPVKAAMAALFALLLAAVLSAQQSDVRLLPLRGNVYLLVGAGANITLSVGKEGVLLVDAGTAQMADKVVAAVAQLAKDVNAPAAARPCAGPGCSAT